MSEKYDMTVEFKGITQPQAIALQAMFELWQKMGSWGSSRMVAFMVDGDGDFRPKIEVGFWKDVYKDMTPERIEQLKAMAKVSRTPDDGCLEDHVAFDFDSIGWSLMP